MDYKVGSKTESSQEDHDHDLPPLKKPKISNEEGKSKQASKLPPRCSDFVASNLEDFYKPNPPFRLPVEIGCFSFDSNGEMVLDKSGLRYFSRPTKLALDLTVGYDKFIPKLNQTPDLTCILTWISHNWGCFLPKLRSDGSLDGKPSNPPSDTAIPSTSIPQQPTDETRFHLRPDDLLTDFICWRGLMTKLICTPYNKSEPWQVIASRHHGTIYLREIETDESKEREANMSSREKQMCYWGLKFEDYLTHKAITLSDNRFSMIDHALTTGVSSLNVDKSGTVNSLEAFCTVVRTRLNTHSIVMAGEVDCIDQASYFQSNFDECNLQNSREKTPQSYIELKTSRFIYTDRNKASFKKNKLMKWWAQSFLVGVPKIICGFRDDDGVIHNLQTFRTVDIPRESQGDLDLWQGNICMNFLDDLLKWVKETVSKDDSQTVYIIEWKHPFTHVSATCHSVTPDLSVLPDWYIQKTSPSSDAS